MRILYVIRDSYPSPRPDVLVLFGRRLPPRGVSSDIVATGAPQADGLPSRWPAGAEFINDESQSTIAKVLGALRLDLRMLRHRTRYDAIVVRDKILTAAIALMIGDPSRVFFWMSYPFPEDDLVRARMPLRSPLYRIALRVRGLITSWLLYRYVIPRAQHVFVQSNRMLDMVATRSGRHGGITAVPMGVDEEIVQQPAPDARRAPAVGEPFRLVYLGSLDRSRHIGFLLEVLAWLQTRHPGRFHLSLVGGASSTEEFDAVHHQVDQMGLRGQTLMTGQVPREQAWAHCAQCHVGLSAIPRGELFDVSSPTKAVEYLAMGMPVVVNDIPDQAYLLNSTNAGKCVPMNVEAFGDAILQVSASYDKVAASALRARQWVLTERGYNALADHVAGVLRQPDPRHLGAAAPTLPTHAR